MTHLFFFNAPATTEIYTLSLHDALPISLKLEKSSLRVQAFRSGEETKDPTMRLAAKAQAHEIRIQEDRKSTRLNSSHLGISYAVFCLKKKKKKQKKKD